MKKSFRPFHIHSPKKMDRRSFLTSTGTAGLGVSAMGGTIANMAMMRDAVASSSGMDMSKYKALFLSDTADHLNEMEEDLVRLEKDPADREGVNNVFRHLHSVKGMASAMGYDSCPMVGFDFESVAKLINLPDDHIICMAVAIGKKTQDIWPRSGQLSLDEAVIHNNF